MWFYFGSKASYLCLHHLQGWWRCRGKYNQFNSGFHTKGSTNLEEKAVSKWWCIIWKGQRKVDSLRLQPGTKIVNVFKYRTSGFNTFECRRLISILNWTHGLDQHNTTCGKFLPRNNCFVLKQTIHCSLSSFTRYWALEIMQLNIFFNIWSPSECQNKLPWCSLGVRQLLEWCYW